MKDWLRAVGLSGVFLLTAPYPYKASGTEAKELCDTPFVFSAGLLACRIVGDFPTACQKALTSKMGTAYPMWVRELAKTWEGLPYGSGGAGLKAHEILLNLSQMDCMTAVENILALHLARQSPNPTPETFAFYLAQVRYSTIPPCRWEDRLHYLTHSFLVWEERGFGSWLPIGRPDPRPIHYLSAHRQKYPGFTDWAYIQKVEARLSRHPRYYIPTAEVQAWLPLLQDGDLIAFVSTEEGLDVSHVGVFFWEGTKATFAHASLKARRWVVGEDLCAYLDKRRSKVAGIAVFRPFP
ncbi:MAG: DUF1460 domain-containing protein [Bacteroidetes bacterium]|nr:MAG: DUF1460 domain-containing protein [Bacteroidota bacterium]